MGTEIQTIKNQMTLKNWAEEVAECQSSGMRVSAWCELLKEKVIHADETVVQVNPEERYTQRQEHSKKVLDGFYAWLETVNPSQGTSLARAVQYARNEKSYLYAFLEDPQIPIDNNLAERAVKPFVIGRKNWLFSTSPKGAEASAIAYSIINTAQANGIDAKEYLTTIFRTGELQLPLKSECKSIEEI